MRMLVGLLIVIGLVAWAGHVVTDAARGRVREAEARTTPPATPRAVPSAGTPPGPAAAAGAPSTAPPATPAKPAAAPIPTAREAERAVEAARAAALKALADRSPEYRQLAGSIPGLRDALAAARRGTDTSAKLDASKAYNDARGRVAAMEAQALAADAGLRHARAALDAAERAEAEALAQRDAEAARARAEAEAAARAPLGVSLAAFYKIRHGMTYDEVKAIVGVDGVEVSSVRLEGMATTTLMSWEQGLLGNMEITFQGGRVVGKSQFGLR